MSVVAVTGLSGYIGMTLARRLAADTEVEAIVGIDVRLPPATFSKLRFFQQDICKPLDRLFQNMGVDTVIHLAFVLNPIHDRREMNRINIEGSKNVLNACRAIRARKLLVASSATAYGAHPDNPPFLTEESPLRANKDFQYAYEKMLLEQLCSEYSNRNPDTAVIIFRPSVVMGPNVSNYLARFMLKPIVASVKGFDAEMQFVHEQDVASAIYQLLKKGRSGAYNVAGDGTVRFSEIAKMFGRRPLMLPAGILYPLTDLAWKLRLSFITEAPASVLDFVRYPWVVSTDKIKREVGVKFQYTSREAIASYIARLNEHQASR